MHIELEDKLTETLLSEKLNHIELQRRINHLVRTYRGKVYSTLLAILTNKSFKEDEAKKHWQGILMHRERMSQKLERDVDFRTAMMDYFLLESRKVKNPVLVEIKFFHETKKSLVIDELTGLYNYRYFMTTLKKEINRSRRYNKQMSILMLDIDDFKKYNDSFGHLAGNQALRKISRILASSVRGMDTVSRYGGEEFAVIFPETGKDGALVVAEKLRARVEKTRYPGKDGKMVENITISGGIATYPVDGKDADELIARADKALYSAKGSGKNAIRVYSNERRAYARFQADLIGSYEILSSEKGIIRAKNISQNGILFKTNRLIPISSIIIMKLKIPGYSRQIKLKTKVVRVEEIKRRKEYDIGVTIIEINQRDRRRLLNYIKTMSS